MKMLRYFSDYSVYYKNAFPYTKRKSSFEPCETQVTKKNLSRHKKRYSIETLYCTQCPNFSTCPKMI